MKIIIHKSKLPLQPEQIIRQVGYGFIVDKRSGQESFVRHPGRNRYPRFHVYIENQGENVVFNLHLDQKEARYPGAHAHNAEYEGEVVEQEVQRIKNYIVQIINSARQSQQPNNQKSTKEKSWFKKFFNN